MNRDARPTVPELLRQYYKEDGRFTKRGFFDYAYKKGGYTLKEARYANTFAHHVHVAAMLQPAGKLSRHMRLALAYLLKECPQDGEHSMFLGEFVLPGCVGKVKQGEGESAKTAASPSATSSLPDSLQSLLDDGSDSGRDAVGVVASSQSGIRDPEIAGESLGEPEGVVDQGPGNFVAWTKDTFGSFELSDAGGSRTRFVSPRAMLVSRFAWEELDRAFRGGEPILGQLIERIDEELVGAWIADSPPDDPFSVDIPVEVPGNEFLAFQAICIIATYHKTKEQGFEERLEAWFSGWSSSLSERVSHGRSETR